MLLCSLSLGEWEWGVAHTVLWDSLIWGKLLGLKVVLAVKGSRLVVTKVGLSITIVASSTVAIATASIASIASILRICAIGLIWSIVKASTVIPVPTAKITPSR